MPDFAREVVPIRIEDEMRRSYLDYAMSVIVGRALPDVRDGLKPVHRRVLFAMHESDTVWNRALRQVRPRGRRRARQVPPPRRHGDLRRPGAHGPALLPALPADRRPGQLRLGGRRPPGGLCATPSAACPSSPRPCWRTSTRTPSISSRTTTTRSRSPRSCPAAFPNLLVNGSSGIAVGMATNIPPHNLREVCDACLALIDEPAASPSTS